LPELPEVETVKQQLEQKVKGLVIKNVKVRKPRLFHGDTKEIIGSKVIDVKRRAKMIIVVLEPKKTHPAGASKLNLLIHLKMTGQLIFVNKNGKYGGGHPIPPFNMKVPCKYTHIEINFQDGSHLYFNDVRQFGWMRVVDSEKLKVESEKIGIDPLSKEFSLKKFQEILNKKKRSKIKQVLMDQSLIAGIGNIYASEICFYAYVLPTRIISNLNQKEIKDLYFNIKKVLNIAIKHNGTSANDYVNLDGKAGKHDKYLMVYGRENQKCKKCELIIKKIKLGQRGTYYCPKCQK